MPGGLRGTGASRVRRGLNEGRGTRGAQVEPRRDLGGGGGFQLKDPAPAGEPCSGLSPFPRRSGSAGEPPGPAARSHGFALGDSSELLASSEGFGGLSLISVRIPGGVLPCSNISRTSM